MTDANEAEIEAAMPAEGVPAPDFTLFDDTGTERHLSDRRGHWTVLFFYPKDDTSGCTIEACEFRDADREYGIRNAEVWGVSILGTGSKARFKAKFGLPFVLLADEDHAVAHEYGTWVQKMNYGKPYMGVRRATFLVDPEGRVARRWTRVKPEGHAQQVLEALDQEQGKTAGSRA